MKRQEPSSLETEYEFGIDAPLIPETDNGYNRFTVWILFERYLGKFTIRGIFAREEYANGWKLDLEKCAREQATNCTFIVEKTILNHLYVGRTL